MKKNRTNKTDRLRTYFCKRKNWSIPGVLAVYEEKYFKRRENPRLASDRKAYVLRSMGIIPDFSRRHIEK